MERLKNKLISNILSLLILQGSNYIFPLITFPFLVRVLGIENYGVLVSITAVMTLLTIIIDYGFNISATREISINTDNKLKVQSIFNEIISIKIVFLLIIFIISTAYFISFGSMENYIIFVVAYSTVLGHTFFPIWFFHGYQEMKFVSYVSIISKFIVLLLLISFVKNPDDLLLVLFLQSLNFILPALISLLIIKNKYGISFSFLFSIKAHMSELNKGKYVFLTTLWISFYSQGPLIILSVISSDYFTGVYGVGQKIQVAVAGIAAPFAQAIYPYMSNLFVANLERFKTFQIYYLSIGIFGAMFISFMTILFAHELSYFSTGEFDDTLVNVIRLFSTLILFSVINTLISRVIYSMNLSRKLNKNYMIAALFFLIAVFPLSFNYNAYGMIFSVILAEGTVLVLNLYTVIKENKINTKKGFN